MKTYICPLCQNLMKINFLFLLNINFCELCNSKFQRISRDLTLHQTKLISIFEYNEYARQVLYKYKTEGNIQIINLVLPFLFFELDKFLDKYKSIDLICIPSSKAKILERGFDPLGEITNLIENKYMNSKINVLKGYVRLDNIQQGKKKLKDRINTKHEYFKYEQTYLKNDTLVIVDDVATTGTTLVNFEQYIGKNEKNIYLSLFASKNLLY